ncbi:hypothetical protein DXV76_07580 [Rhodobacteraceae bacterium CCMM004]|nr:hypothetical protein DXV76_07580 [Rhodobacteraceae bacterium CCMM004]
MSTGAVRRIDLTQVPAHVISMPGQNRRQKLTRALFERLEIGFDFVDGIVGERKIRACALAHARALAAAPAPPFAVFEDDLQCPGGIAVPPLPGDADILYLGTNTAGCFPNQRRYWSVFNHRSVGAFCLAQPVDDALARVWSMVGAHAYAVLSDRGAEVWRGAVETALREGLPVDVAFAYVQPQVTALALRRPMFCEDPRLQGRAKRAPERQAMTADPIPMAAPGERRRGLKSRWIIDGVVTRTGAGGLEWTLADYAPRS